MKSILSIAAAFILVFSAFSIPAKAVVSFDDVPMSHGFVNEIIYLHKEGIISGYPDGNFRPNAPVSRAHAMTMIGRALEFDGTQRTTPFKDVPASHPNSGFIAEGAEAEIIFGYPGNYFRPGETLNRGQTAMMLDRAFDFPNAPLSSFSDMGANVGSNDAVSRLAYQGVAQGFPDNTFRPQQKVTRGQFAAFLARTAEPSFISEKQELLNTANDILTELKAKDFVDVASYVGNDGLTFCPYSGGCLNDETVTFAKNQLPGFMTDQKEYLWGYEDGSGFSIELTPRAYYNEYLMNAAYSAKERYDRTEQSMTQQQIRERFPQATGVEFYYPGTSANSYMDWQNLTMVFEKDSNGQWKLIAFVNGRWTI